MNIFQYAIKDNQEIVNDFNVDLARGLSNRQVLAQRAQHGFNKLSLKGVRGIDIFLRQFKSSFVYLLLLVLLITLFLGEIVDSIMIFAFLLINITLGFYQEYRSEKIVQLLNRFALPKAKVFRNGKVIRISSEDLVPGDIMILETGDKILADARLLEQSNFMVDESILTGESIPVFKKVEKLNSLPCSYHMAENLVFSGSDVLSGQARLIVLSTGKNTIFGGLAKLTSDSVKVSDFQNGINRFSQFILKLVILTLGVLLISHLLIKKGTVNFFDLIIFAVALTVSVIPEALPLVTTFSLSRGAKKLSAKNVIVKRLSAIEDLGGIEILCSDKTGTLTENKLKIANIYSENANHTVLLGNLASSFELEKRIEPFDIALEQALSAEQKRDLKKAVRIYEEPFDPRLKRNASLVQLAGKTFLVIRGAPEKILLSCSAIWRKNHQSNIYDWVKREGLQGHRVLSIAYKEIHSSIESYDFAKQLNKNDFIFSGVVSFVDPIKKSSFAAVRKAKQLGVRLIIITGDSMDVAGEVATEIGLINDPSEVLLGEKWHRANEEERLNYLEKYSVLARVSPEDKFEIISTLRSKYSVGFLGEGINDAPALKIAGVSIVVDSAADIAREAADVILLKKNLEVVIDGIREGRQVFVNTTKYIKSTLAANFGNFFAVATASLLIDFLPMLSIQILLVNLLSDTPMIAVSTDSVDAKELKSPKKYEVKEIIIIAIILGVVSTIFDFIFFALFYKISPEVLRTNWFIGSILTELVLIFSIRTQSFFIKGVRPSSSLFYLSFFTAVLTVVLPFTNFGQNIFHFTAPSMSDLILIFSLVVVYFIISEVVKIFYYKGKCKENNSLIHAKQ